MSPSFGDKQDSCPVVKENIQETSESELLIKFWAGEMTWWLGTLAVPTEDLVWVPFIHMGAHNIVTLIA